MKFVDTQKLVTMQPQHPRPMHRILMFVFSQENEAVTAEQYARESIRIARTTRELLKK